MKFNKIYFKQMFETQIWSDIRIYFVIVKTSDYYFYNKW